MTRVWRILIIVFWALLLMLIGTVFWLWWGIDDLRQPNVTPAKPVAAVSTEPRLTQVAPASAVTPAESPSAWSCAKAQVRIKQLEFAKDILNVHVGMSVTGFPQEIQSRVDADMPIYPPYENHAQSELESMAAAGDVKAAAVAGIRISQNGFPRHFPGLPERPTREEQVALEEKAEALLRQAITGGVKGLLNEYTDVLRLQAWRLSPERNQGLTLPGYEDAQARYVAMVQLSFEYDDLYGAFLISMENERVDAGDMDAGDPVQVEKNRQNYLKTFSAGLLVEVSSDERRARQWLHSLLRGVPEMEELRALRQRCTRRTGV